MKIFKYELTTVPGTSRIEAPLTFYPMKVAIQDGKVMLWAKVDESQTEKEQMTEHKFTALPTGSEILFPDNHYIDTVFADDLVWHIYRGEIRRGII